MARPNRVTCVQSNLPHDLLPVAPKRTRTQDLRGPLRKRFLAFLERIRGETPASVPMSLHPRVVEFEAELLDLSQEIQTRLGADELSVEVAQFGRQLVAPLMQAKDRSEARVLLERDLNWLGICLRASASKVAYDEFRLEVWKRKIQLALLEGRTQEVEHHLEARRQSLRGPGRPASLLSCQLSRVLALLFQDQNRPEALERILEEERLYVAGLEPWQRTRIRELDSFLGQLEEDLPSAKDGRVLLAFPEDLALTPEPGVPAWGEPRWKLFESEAPTPEATSQEGRE